MLEYKYTLKGGNLTSIKIDNEERQYQPMEGSWQGQDVVIFPFVARLINQTYTHNGKSYSMNIHGLARYNNFVLEEKTPNSDTILFKSNEETKKQYPFDFEFRVKYLKEENKLTVSYIVKNTGNEIMPFGIGGHPAIKVPYENNDTKGNYLVFDKKENLTQIVLDESGCFIKGQNEMGIFSQFELSKEFFKKYNTLIIDASKIKGATLKLKNGKKVRFTFSSKYLALWSHVECGDYVCVEPWESLPDYVNCPLEICDKKSLIHLKPNNEYAFSYNVEFES